MYSLEGLYLTVLEPITYKQTERAIYIGDSLLSLIRRFTELLSFLQNVQVQNAKQSTTTNQRYSQFSENDKFSFTDDRESAETLSQSPNIR